MTDNPTDVIQAELRALNGYRAAVSYISADSWDGCSDCIEILRAARSADINWDWAGDTNRIAEELKAIRPYAKADTILALQAAQHRQKTLAESDDIFVQIAAEAAPRYEPVLDDEGNDTGYHRDIATGQVVTLGDEFDDDADVAQLRQEDVEMGALSPGMKE